MIGLALLEFFVRFALTGAILHGFLYGVLVYKKMMPFSYKLMICRMFFLPSLIFYDLIAGNRFEQFNKNNYWIV